LILRRRNLPFDEVAHHSGVSVRVGDLGHPASETGESASPDLAPMFMLETPCFLENAVHDQEVADVARRENSTLARDRAAVRIQTPSTGGEGEHKEVPDAHFSQKDRGGSLSDFKPAAQNSCQ
jgi:hypothetical protein